MQSFHTKYNGWTAIATAGLVAISVTGSAQQMGTLHFRELSPQAHAYVDEKTAVVKNGNVVLSAGWHRVQVETILPKIGVVAYHRSVQIMARHTTEMRLVWHSVRIDMDAPGRPAYSPPGQPGPVGETGPPARPYQPLPTPADRTVLRPLLQQTRDALLDDMTAQVQDTLNSISGENTLVYLYTPQPPARSLPPGPQGEIGPVGPPGLPAEVGLIQTQASVPVCDVLAQRLGLPVLEQSLVALQQRLQALSQARINRSYIPPEPFHILTPIWKAEYDHDWKQARTEMANNRFHGEYFGISGNPGVAGRRGRDGIPPSGAMPLHLTPSEEKTLLEELTGDKPTQERIQQVRRLLAQLDERVYVAEGEELETARSLKTSTASQ